MCTNVCKYVYSNCSTQLSLNEGSFQLRLYHGPPNSELDYNIHMFDNHRSVSQFNSLLNN